MFKNLKTKNNRQSVFKNSERLRNPYSRSPGTSSSVTKHNEGYRLVRCRVCGFICDRERDVSIKPHTFAGLGVSFGSQKTANASIGDAKTPAAGPVSSTPDRYYEREVSGGCPCCGTYMYDPSMAPEKIPS